MTSTGQSLVTVVIPTLNEAADIAGCIETVIAQDYPHHRIELVLADGESDDATVEVARRTVEAGPLSEFSIVRNHQRRTSAGLNLALAQAKGDIVVRLDARSRVGPTYISSCVRLLESDPTIGVVGGAQVAWPRGDRPVDRGIARALNNRLATGASRYRRSATSGRSDTVWMGVFRRRDLERLGGWNSEFGVNEDWDLNDRFRQAGLDVYVLADQRSGYLPRRGLAGLRSQYFGYGYAKGTWWVRGQRITPRQVVTVLVPPLAGVILAVAVRRYGPRATMLLPLGAVVVDEIGAQERTGNVGERLASIVAMATFTTSWWVGVLAGAAAETFGIEARRCGAQAVRSGGSTSPAAVTSASDEGARCCTWRAVLRRKRALADAR
jgi:succinoglycan biosynthesis protein ExoA